MFLLGEMPRDPFGGESRDLEPFGRVNNRESLYAPTVCDRPLSVLAGDLAKVIDFLDQRNRDLHPDRVAGSRRESSHPAVRCVILWALQRAYGPGQVHHAFAQQERANAMKNCGGFRFRDFHVFQIINRKGIDNGIEIGDHTGGAARAEIERDFTDGAAAGHRLEADRRFARNLQLGGDLPGVDKKDEVRGIAFPDQVFSGMVFPALQEG